MKEKIKLEFTQFKLLLRSVPGWLTALFVMSVFAMNILANKSISLPVSWLALDCGIIVSWFAFLAMDTVTRRFGPKGATQLSIVAICFNLLFCLIFFVGSKIGGVWGESAVEGSENIINNALDNTIGGTWYVVLGSTVAFVASAIINNFTNWGTGRLFRKKSDGAVAYIVTAYVSTAVAQFADNLIFALIVSLNFFGWTILQCVTCALTGMIAELLFEVVFSFLGYKICQKWKKEGVGKEYIDFVASSKIANAEIKATE